MKRRETAGGGRTEIHMFCERCAVAAGVYFYQLETPTTKLARKVTLLR
jgi:hypothetical protein